MTPPQKNAQTYHTQKTVCGASEIAGRHEMSSLTIELAAFCTRGRGGGCQVSHCPTALSQCQSHIITSKIHTRTQVNTPVSCQIRSSMTSSATSSTPPSLPRRAKGKTQQLCSTRCKLWCTQRGLAKIYPYLAPHFLCTHIFSDLCG